MYGNTYNQYPGRQPSPPQMGAFNSYAPQPLPSGLKGRPVASIEEVKASPIDFDGSISIFPDFANRKIYTKQINLDGTVLLNIYELKETPVVENSNYITREEFENTLLQLRNQLNQVFQPNTQGVQQEELKSF